VARQNTADDVLIDFKSEGLGQMLSDLGAAKSGVAPLELADDLNQLCSWSFRSWLSLRM
jgi:hypothetical protein